MATGATLKQSLPGCRMKTVRCQNRKGTTMSPTSWDEVADGGPEQGWTELPETGWGMLAAWAAGTENIRRYPVDDTGRQVRVTTETGTSTETRFDPFTTSDRQAVDEDIESYLADAGVPAPPRGYTWLIRLPETVGTENQFWQEINKGLAAAAPGAVHPRDISPVVERIVDALYGRD